ncbi:MAG: nickel-dependent lactate racemase [Chloroflexi bacterium]|nr:nickel-dependent lactate racemase [Chloroflexota bacterium]
MLYTLPYGHDQITVHVPDTFQVDLLTPQVCDPLPDPNEAIFTALGNPVGGIGQDLIKNTQTVGIAINDKTRPVPKPNPIVHLLNHLESLRFAPDQVTLFIGSGTHTPMTPDELPQILDPSIIERYRVHVHDCDRSPMADLGKSSDGNPIHINADFYNCDLKFSVGNIEPHHFMGFSGGIKTAAIGLAGRATIDANHAGLTHPYARTGEYNINPLRQEIEEIGRKAGVQFSLGTILDEHKRVLKVFFGSPLAVMDAAIPLVRQYFGVEVSAPYDLVIASPGGAPKDINLYQSQKGLTHAARITRDGGWVVLLAACPEGSGSASYEGYIRNADSHQAVIDHFQSGFFQVGPHKAFQIAREALRINIVLVSEIPPKTVKAWKLTPSKPELINDLTLRITNQLSADARIAILPAATRTMTEVKK